MWVITGRPPPFQAPSLPNSPQLIKARREALAHQLTAHSPVRFRRHPAWPNRSPAPPRIDRIHYGHRLRGTLRLNRREQVTSEFAWLPQVEPADAFEWFRVSTAVGNVRNQGAQLIQPL